MPAIKDYLQSIWSAQLHHRNLFSVLRREGGQRREVDWALESAGELHGPRSTIRAGAISRSRRRSQSQLSTAMGASLPMSLPALIETTKQRRWNRD